MATPQRTEVDDVALARILRCDAMTLRRYIRQRVIKREPNKKFALFLCVGQVVEYLRGMASVHTSQSSVRAGAALKDAQRRLTDLKFAKLDGQVLAMPEIEAVWNDLTLAAKWLFLTVPARTRRALQLSEDQEQCMKSLCAEMLREVAFSGPVQLATRDLDDDDAETSDEPALDDSVQRDD